MTDQTPDVEEVSELATLADVIYDAGHPSIDHADARHLAEAVARHLAELGILKDRLLATQDTRDYLRFELEQARVERERTRALVAAARRWRAQFEKPTQAPRQAAVIAAVDALDNAEQATAITARAPEVDVDVETGAALLALVRRSVVWLDDTNGTGEAETRLRILKVVEEVGEVAAAVIGAVGQNPRKGVTHTLDDVAGELIDVALTAMVAAHSLRHADIAAMVADGVAKVAGRLDAMGVPA